MMPRDRSTDSPSDVDMSTGGSNVPQVERPRENRSASPIPRISTAVDKGKRTEERRWQQRDANEGVGNVARSSWMTESHSQHPQQAQGRRILPPLSHMIPMQANDRRISQTTDLRSSGAQHIMLNSEAPQEGLATRRTSSGMSSSKFSSHPSIPPGPPYTDPPRYPSSLSLPPPPPPPPPPPKSDEPSREPRREGRGLAFSLHNESNDRSRTSIGSLLSPSTSHFSPHPTGTSTSASQDLQPAASSPRKQVDQPSYGLVSAGHSLGGRRREQGDFDDSGTASNFLMRTRRSRSPFQVDLTNPSDRRIRTPHFSDQATVSHSTPNDRSAESSTGPSASNASRTIVDGTGGNAFTSTKAWSVERAAAATLATSQGPAAALRNAMPRSPRVQPSDEYSRLAGHSTAESSGNTVNASLSAPALTQVFKEWLSDVARQAVSTHDDPALERKLTKALAARDDLNVDPRLKELGHGLLAGPMVPSSADMAQGREYPSAFSTSNPHGHAPAYAAYPFAEGSSQAAEQEAVYEVDRAEAIQDAYRQGYSDGVQAERKRSYQEARYQRAPPEPLFWPPPEPQQDELQNQSLTGSQVGTKYLTSSSSGKRRRTDIGPSSVLGRSGKRQPISCNNCRLRKLKCDGVPPASCSACAKRSGDDPCEYVAFIRRRGPGKKIDGQHMYESVSPQWRKYGDGDAFIGDERSELDEHDELLSPSAVEVMAE